MNSTTHRRLGKLLRRAERMIPAARAESTRCRQESVRVLSPLEAPGHKARTFSAEWDFAPRGIDLRPGSIHAGWEGDRWWIASRAVGVGGELWAVLVDATTETEVARTKLAKAGRGLLGFGNTARTPVQHWRVAVVSEPVPALRSTNSHHRRTRAQEQLLDELRRASLGLLSPSQMRHLGRLLSGSPDLAQSVIAPADSNER